MARRLTAVVVVAITHVVGATSGVFALCEAMTDAEAFARVDAVFTGRPVAVDDGWLRSNVAWRFDVDGVYKGDVFAVQVVHTPDRPGMEELLFQLGDRYQVFAFADDDAYRTDQCWRNRNLRSQAPFEPMAASEPRSGDAGDDGPPLWLYATDALMILVALFAIVFGPRLLRKRKRDGP